MYEVEQPLAVKVEATSWYHTIALPQGIVTPGHFDTRAALERVPLPQSLVGKRCLDVGTADGFWAFELERRGAMEVVATDIYDPGDYDWPDPRPKDPWRPAKKSPGPTPGFQIAHRALESNVQWKALSVYDLPSGGLGEFDFVFMGSLLLHLRDPVGALRAVREVVRGEFMSADQVSLATTLTHPRTAAASLAAVGEPRWWTPNMVAYRRLLTAAGFEIVQTGGPYFLPFGDGFDLLANGSKGKASMRRRVSLGSLAFRLLIRPLGAPCMWARCRPAPLGDQ